MTRQRLFMMAALFFLLLLLHLNAALALALTCGDIVVGRRQGRY